MKCPRHGVEAEKVRIDVYYCPDCDHDWLIHGYRGEARGKKKRG